MGMLLDQQIPMEWAFSGPYTILQRMGGGDDLDAHVIAAYDPEGFAALLSTSPPCTATRIHGQAIQQLCAFLVEHYDGDAEAVWRTAGTGRDLQAPQ